MYSKIRAETQAAHTFFMQFFEHIKTGFRIRMIIKNLSKIILPVLLMTICPSLVPSPLSAEFLFLDDGSIIRDSIINRTGGKIQLKENGKIPAEKIIRIHYNSSYVLSMYKMGKGNKTGKIEGYVVEKTDDKVVMIVDGKVCSYPSEDISLIKSTEKSEEVSKKLFQGMGLSVRTYTPFGHYYKKANPSFGITVFSELHRGLYAGIQGDLFTGENTSKGIMTGPLLSYDWKIHPSPFVPQVRISIVSVFSFIRNSDGSWFYSFGGKPEISPNWHIRTSAGTVTLGPHVSALFQEGENIYTAGIGTGLLF